MLSTRAKNILSWAGYDLTDTEGTRRKLQDAMRTGIRWRNCGRKTMREFEQWLALPSVVNAAINDSLIERGAISFLEAKGYTIIRTAEPSPCGPWAWDGRFLRSNDGRGSIILALDESYDGPMPYERERIALAWRIHVKTPNAPRQPEPVGDRLDADVGQEDER